MLKRKKKLTRNQDLGEGEHAGGPNTVGDLTKGILQEGVGGTLDDITDDIEDHGEGQGLGTAKDIRHLTVEGNQRGRQNLKDGGQDTGERSRIKDIDDVGKAVVHNVDLERVDESLEQDTIVILSERGMRGRVRIQKFCNMATWMQTLQEGC